MNCCVFVTVLGVKLLQNNQSLQNFVCGVGCEATAVSLTWHNFFVLCGKKLIMQERETLASRVDLPHRILSDTLSWNPSALKS